MNEWIECNLPWLVRLESTVPVMVPYPDMDDKIRARFGATIDEWEERFFPGLDDSDLGFVSEHPLYREYLEIRDQLELDHSEEEVKQKLQLHPSVAVQTVLACRGICKEIDAWVEEQPEFIAACNTHDMSWKKHHEMEDKLSFCGRHLNRAGTLIEYEKDGKLTYMIIGHINELGGSCDDCRGINNDTVILRYKVLWDGQTS
jgi:hypothetical protein